MCVRGTKVSGVVVSNNWVLFHLQSMFWQTHQTEQATPHNTQNGPWAETPITATRNINKQEPHPWCSSTCCGKTRRARRASIHFRPTAPKEGKRTFVLVAMVGIRVPAPHSLLLRSWESGFLPNRQYFSGAWDVYVIPCSCYTSTFCQHLKEMPISAYCLFSLCTPLQVEFTTDCAWAIVVSVFVSVWVLLDVYVTDNHDVIAFGRRTMSMGRLLLIRLFVSLDVKPKVYVLFFVPDNHVLPVSPFIFYFLFSRATHRVPRVWSGGKVAAC